MSSPDPNNVHIRLEVNVPTGLNVLLNQVQTSPERAEPNRINPFWDKATLPGSAIALLQFATLPVRIAGSGSLGSICISFLYLSGTAPTCVKAAMYPQATAPQCSPNPPPTAQAGTPSSENTVWTWNGSNELQGAAYSPSPGTANVIFLWTSPDHGKTWVLDRATFTFYGVTGTSGPCGSGSGGGSVVAVSSSGMQIYPAVWIVPLVGFARQLGAFNAAWALQRVQHSHVPAWDNGGDGQHAPKLHLDLQPHGWELHLKLGSFEATLKLPVGATKFGPLSFEKAELNVPGFGHVVVPPIQLVTY